MNRKPPRQPDWRAPKGTCKWCGQPILKPDGQPARLGWHPDCVTTYRVANFQSDAIRALRRRDHGVCASCGSTVAQRLTERRQTYDYGWCADHIIPLWSVGRDAPDAFRFWTLENLQTLCEPCHKVKTKREAGERARLRANKSSLPLGAAQPPAKNCAA